MRVACSCTWRPASVQRNAFERARSARRARNRAGLGVMAPLVKTAHVSSMACLAAWSRTHLFFIVFFFSILTLPLSSLSPCIAADGEAVDTQCRCSDGLMPTPCTPPDREAVEAKPRWRCGLMPSRAQFALQHLARGRHGQLHTELDETWILVVGHVLLRPGHQLDFCDGPTVLDNNERFDLFPVTVVWHADAGCQSHCRMGHQHLFVLDREEAVAAAHN